MKTQQVKYTSGGLGKLIEVVDFLPKPQDLVFPEDNVKVTLSLSRSSLDFFKEEARINKVPYQRMIRNLVDQYAQKVRA